MSEGCRRLLCFGDFTVDTGARTLQKFGHRLKLHRQPFEVLLLLIDRAGEVVTREELRTKLWPEGTFVDFENSLNAAVKKLRQTLGDSATEPRFIETLPRIGYRFIASVEWKQPTQIQIRKEASPVAAPALSAPLGESEKSRLLPLGRTWKTWGLASAVLLVVVGAGLGYRWKKNKHASPVPDVNPKVVAVLPFSNDGAGPDLDYLRYAIPAEVITDLSNARSLSVRSFASTSAYASHPADPAIAGRNLRVPYVISGGYSLENKSLRITLKMIDVSRNQPIWHDEIKVVPSQLLALDRELAVRSTQSILAILKIPQSSLGEIPKPANENAFDLYLRSLGNTHNYPGSNSAAIKNLEESAALDSRYAPVWRELCWRARVEYLFGDRDAASLTKSEDACKQEVSLDPGDVFDAPIQMDVRQGGLYEAYDEAADLLRRRPDSSDAHYAMGVVLWFAGLLDEAENQCAAALAIDPGNQLFTSCARPFVLQGRYDLAAKYLYLGDDPVFTGWVRTEIDLRSGDNAAALADAHVASRAHLHFDDLIRLYLDHAPQADFNPVVAGIEKTESDPKTQEEPQTLYDYATVLSFSGQSDAALDILRRTIQKNYCSYPAMDNDPLFNSIRRRPEFVALRQEAIQCQQKFLAHREHVDAAMQAGVSERQ